MYKPKDSVTVLPGGKIKITMNIQIHGENRSENPEPFDSSREAISWVNGQINTVKGLYNGGELTKEEEIELVERYKKVKEKILALNKQ
jgi:hypothetical protein